MKDSASVTNPNDFFPLNYSINWLIDMENEKINGKCEIKIKNLSSSKILNLDILDININSIKCNGKELNYKINDFTSFGKNLEIELNECNNEFVIEIEYISSKGPALCWLNPDQTAGKQYKYVFSQGEVYIFKLI